ncbi:hypothetical protein [Deinococcus radiodurans]|uniref:hypothetical protein n=1 Tax=Deinococcus radiodurans TaxID=1299 RepID=UPI000A56D9F5
MRAKAAPRARPRRRRAPRWPWWVLGGGLLLGAVAYAPQLFGGQVLSRYGKDLGISAGNVSGPLWSPKLSQVAFDQPGVHVTAGEASAHVAGVDWNNRTVRVDVTVADAAVALRLKDLVETEKRQSPGNGWKVVLGSVDVQRSRLTVDGTGLNVPAARLNLHPGPDKTVAFDGQTPDGKLSGQLKVAERGAANVYAVTFDADARILRHYWGGVRAGRLQGRYVFGEGPVHGDVKLTGGLLRVPQASFVTVREVTGRALHRGENITLNLAGQAWDGPVSARGGVDLAAKHWTVAVGADPTVGGWRARCTPPGRATSNCASRRAAGAPCASRATPKRATARRGPPSPGCRCAGCAPSTAFSTMRGTRRPRPTTSPSAA